MDDENMLTDEEVLLLENLTYFKGPNGESLVSPGNEGVTVGEFLDNIDTSQYIDEKDYGSYITGEDWKNTIQAIQNNDTLMNMEIAATHVDNTNDGGGGKSVVFVNEDTGEAVVAFCGTAENEWKDDFIGGGPTNASDGVSTAHQENALEWYQDVYQECGLDDYTVTLTGHSKGGNKAKYITLLDGTVDRCLSFDGQGFSDEFMMRYADEIVARQSLIENHNVDYDFVNPLLNDVGNTTYYQGYDLGKGGFLEYHCPNTFFNFGDNGEFTMNVAPNGQAEEMIVLDDFLNSYLRSMDSQDKAQALDLVGTIAQGVASKKGLWFFIELMWDKDNRETAAYLLAYTVKYGQENPEFMNAVEGILQKFGVKYADKIVDVIQYIIDRGDFDIDIEILDGSDIKVNTSSSLAVGSIIGSAIHSGLNSIMESFRGAHNPFFSVKHHEMGMACQAIDKCCTELDKAGKDIGEISGRLNMQGNMKSILSNLAGKIQAESRECRVLQDALQQSIDIYADTEASLAGM